MTKPNTGSFGEYLRKLRLDDSLPLRKIAALLDIDTSMLAKIERNERYPTKALIKKMAAVFKLDEQKLLIEFLSDKIAYQVLEEEDGLKALKMAEQKVKYLKKKKTK